MTDYKALCAEILKTLDDYEGGLRVDWDNWRERARAALAQPEPVEDRVAELEAELERGRLRLAACGVVAMADTPESAARARDMPLDYHSASLDDVIRQVDALMELRSKLAQSEPVGPTFAEIMELAEDFFTFRGNSHGESFFATDLTAKTDPAQASEAFARAVLERWGRPASAPIPISERLPVAEDCDAGGRCWFSSRLNANGRWNLEDRTSGLNSRWYSHWLPHWALPLPEAEV
jgi:hypothetical protein